MRVYIAAPFQLRADAHILMQALDRAGVEVTSTWITAPGQPDCEESALVDLEDLDRAHVVVLLNPMLWHDRGTGGRHVELGYALARQKPVVLVGCRSNVFHYLSPITFVDTVGEVPSALLKHVLASTTREGANATA